MDYQIFRIRYETAVAANREAVVAARSAIYAPKLLIDHLRSDPSIKERDFIAKSVLVADMKDIQYTGVNANLEAVISTGRPEGDPRSLASEKIGGSSEE